MVWLEFKIAETSHAKVQEEWRKQGKTLNEIAELMEKRLNLIAKDNNTFSGNQTVTKFPKLVRDLMKAQLVGKGSMSHDVDNDIYKVKLAGDLPDAGDFYEEFDLAYKQLIKENDSIREWSQSNDVRITMSGHDEGFEMKALETSNPSQGSTVVPKEQAKE